MTDFAQISSTQTDAGKPIDKLLMDTGLRQNMDALYEIIGSIGAGPFGYYSLVDDFCVPTGIYNEIDRISTGQWAWGSNGQETSVSIVSYNSDNKHVGILSLWTGNGSGNDSYIENGNLKTGNGEIIYESLIMFPDLPTSSQKYAFTMSLNDDTDLIPDNGFFFEYNVGKSNYWLYGVRASSTGASNASDVEVLADTWYRLRIVINAAGDSASFYIGSGGGDLALAGTVTTNIPTTFLKPVFKIYKYVGDDGKIVYIDYVRLTKVITGGR